MKYYDFTLISIPDKIAYIINSVIPSSLEGSNRGIKKFPYRIPTGEFGAAPPAAGPLPPRGFPGGGSVPARCRLGNMIYLSPEFHEHSPNLSRSAFAASQNPPDTVVHMSNEILTF